MREVYHWDLRLLTQFHLVAGTISSRPSIQPNHTIKVIVMIINLLRAIGITVSLCLVYKNNKILELQGDYLMEILLINPEIVTINLV